MAKRESDPVRIQLTLGILGFLGVLLGVLATIFAPIIQDYLRQRNQPTQTPIVIIATPTLSTPDPTDTVPPNAPTSTPAPTDTPAPTLTFTPTPLEAGKDWLEDCLSLVWRVFPESLGTSTNGNCYGEPLANVFSVRNQSLEVFYNGRATADEVVGIFVEIPSDSLVEFTARFSSIDTGELWMGVFAERKIDTSGIVLGAPQGNPTNSAFVVHKMPDDNRYTTGKIRKDSGDYLVSFDVSPSSVTVILEKYTTIDTAAVASTNNTKWLFIGYKVLSGKTNFISGNISDLKITPR